jgi:hypothetical protein
MVVEILIDCNPKRCFLAICLNNSIGIVKWIRDTAANRAIRVLTLALWGMPVCARPMFAQRRAESLQAAAV